MSHLRLSEKSEFFTSRIQKGARLFAVAAGLAILAACGGGGGGGGVGGVTPSVGGAGAPGIPSAVATAPAPTPSPTATPILTSGTIASVTASGFTLQTGYPHGYINVATNANTRIVGAKPYAKENVSVSATGSWSTSLTAIWVTQSGYATPTPVPTAAPTPVPTATPLPAPTATPIVTSGTITSLISGGFTLQTGYPHGYVNVRTNASTQFTGAKPYVNESVSVSATGSWYTGLIAISVTQAGYATPSPKPVVTATPVATPKPTPKPTPTLAPTPKPTVAPTATPMPKPVGTAPPAHIPSWAYDEYWAEGANASAGAVRQYLSYAEGGRGNAKAQSDCAGSSCKSVFYFDPNMQYAGATCPIQPDAQFISAASESWFVHKAGYTDSAHRLHGSYNQSCKGSSVSIPVYLASDANPGVQSYFNTYLRNNGDSWDYYFMDDTSTSVVNQTYGAGGGFCGGICSTTQELPNDAAVTQEHVSFANALSHRNGSPDKFFFNGVDFNGQTPTNIQLLSLGAGHFVGAVCENCVISAGTFRPTMYAKVLNAMAAVDAMPGAAFIELNTGASPAGSSAQIAQRTVTTAMAWLGFSDGHTIVWPNLEYNTKNLAVWPEEMIYPVSPVQTMSASGGSNDIQVATGVFRREFAGCYENQAAIGPCAAIVNSTSSTVTVSSAWLRQSYSHIVSMNGGDLLSGGTVGLTSTAFKANATTIAPGQALLLVR